LDLSGSRQGPVAGSVNKVMNLKSSMKCGEFLDQLTDYQLPRKDSVHGALLVWLLVVVVVVAAVVVYLNV
jgi:hypothetical protein